MANRPSGREPVIEFRHVSYQLNGGQELLSEVTFTVERGETLVLLGRSGAGKTTALKLINRLLEPTEGELEGWEEDRTHARVSELLEMVGLDPGKFARRYPHELSGGQRQRVGVARALAADPPILLMDEPFGALDPLTRGEVQREFQALERRLRKTVVIVTHHVGEALALGTRIGLVEAGKLAGIYSPKEFLESTEPVTAAYVAYLRMHEGIEGGE